jgi:hypothetical protein
MPSGASLLIQRIGRLFQIVISMLLILPSKMRTLQSFASISLLLIQCTMQIMVFITENFKVWLKYYSSPDSDLRTIIHVEAPPRTPGKSLGCVDDRSLANIEWY